MGDKCHTLDSHKINSILGNGVRYFLTNKGLSDLNCIKGEITSLTKRSDGYDIITDKNRLVYVKFPFKGIGQRVWIQERCAPNYYGQGIHAYKAATQEGIKLEGKTIFRPSSQMPKEAARITLSVRYFTIRRVSSLLNEGVCPEEIERSFIVHCYGIRLPIEEIKKADPYIWTVIFHLVEVRASISQRSLSALKSLQSNA